MEMNLNLIVNDGFQISGPDNLENLRKIAEQFQKQQPPTAAQPTQEDDDDEVPELVAGETFETAAEDSHASHAS